MKNFKIIFAIVFCISIVLVSSCKQNKTEPEVISVDNKVPVKKSEDLATAHYSKAAFTIKGMTCQIGCAATIEKKLAKMEGVKSAKVNFEKEMALVEYNTETIDTDDLVKTVVSIGNGGIYSVEDLKEVE